MNCIFKSIYIYLHIKIDNMQVLYVNIQTKYGKLKFVNQCSFVLMISITCRIEWCILWFERCKIWAFSIQNSEIYMLCFQAECFQLFRRNLNAFRSNAFWVGVLIQRYGFVQRLRPDPRHATCGFSKCPSMWFRRTTRLHITCYIQHHIYSKTMVVEKSGNTHSKGNKLGSSSSLQFGECFCNVTIIFYSNGHCSSHSDR